MRPTYKTLQQLRDDLAVSLGFGAMGGAQPNQIPYLTQVLQQSQNYLWGELKLNSTSRTHVETLGMGQEVLDVPSDCQVGYLRGVFYKDGNVWVRLHHGLPDEYDLSIRDTPQFYGVNTRYDKDNLQIQFYPIPQEPVEIRMDYFAQPNRFARNDDRASVPDHLLMTLAIGTAKMHYQQADGQVYMDRYQKEMRRVKSQNFEAEGSMRCNEWLDPYSRAHKYGGEN